MQRGRYIIDDPYILIQTNDHILLEVRGRYITDDPTIRLHFAKKRKKEKKKSKGRQIRWTVSTSLFIGIKIK